MKKMRHTLPLVLTILFFLPVRAVAARADTSPPEFRLANVFNSSMVMQCDKAVTVWGWAKPGASVTVTLSQDAKLIAPYQGEHEHTFPKVIESFRAAYGDAELPFGIIGLPGWGTQPTDEENVMCSSNVLIRDIHTRTHNKMKGTGLVQTYDLGDGTIHPGDKRPVAERAARWALFRVYKKGVQHRGPKYSRMEIDGSNIYLYFVYDPHLLSDERIEKYKPYWAVVPNPKAGGNAKIRGFVIAGKDRRWYPAETQRDMRKGRLAGNINSKSPELAKKVAELDKLIVAIKKEIDKVQE